MILYKSTFTNDSDYDDSSSGSSEEDDYPEIQKYEVIYFWYEIIIRIGATGILAVYGIITNVINIIIFYRLDLLSDSCNACLAVLAVSDLICSFLTLWGTVCIILLNTLNQEEMDWHMSDIAVMTAFSPKRIFIQFTCWTTAYIASERCFCVVFPFKHHIFTPKRAYAVVLCLFVVNFAFQFPCYIKFVPRWEDIDGKNYSRLVFVFNDIIDMDIYSAFEVLNSFILRVVSIIILYVCNFIIFWKVNQSQEFKRSATATSVSKNKRSETGFVKGDSNDDEERDKAAATTKIKNLNTTKDSNIQKEQKLMRMITVLCTMTLICYTPETFFIIVDVLIYETPWEVHLNILAIIEVLDTLNSSINIHIYYKMSTRYRNELRKFLCIKKM